MTFMGKLTSLFPTIHAFLVILCFVLFVVSPSLFSFTLIPTMIYGIPIALFKIHERTYKIEPGIYDLEAPEYCPWWGAYNIQQLFNAFPALEALLLLYPPAYSAWLRLWGSKIGKNVYFTPKMTILDRSMLNIGDNVTFGYDSKLTCHVITRKKGGTSLLLAPITVENGCLIGALTKLGPGCHIKEGVVVGYGREVWLNEVVHESDK